MDAAIAPRHQPPIGTPQRQFLAEQAGSDDAMAREVASRSITVNCVAPGFVDTEMTRGMPHEARDALLRDIPLGRVGTASEVADGICFLLSDAASYITGAVLRINGGLLM